MSGGAPRAVTMVILVAALGYFVDIYDLILFSVVRTPSLIELGVPKEQLLDRGVLLINMQMGGMLLGGILWGVLGDKRGRLSVLFGSIALYSVANVLNGFVQSLDQYAALRLVAGIGLAGELGAGITLVAEGMSKESRGYGTTVVATVGICGAVVAVLVATRTTWRTSYLVGGGLGIGLLLLRVGVYESGLFESARTAGVERGNFGKLFVPWARFRRYASVILVGVPIWYAVGVLVTFASEIGADMGMSPAPTPRLAVLWSYVGLAVGDLASGALSQVLRSRRRVVGGFLVLTAASVGLYFTVGKTSPTAFYAVCAILGFATGYWAVFVTMASEQFGTNLRATATTTAPNFVRGAVVPVTSAFTVLKGPLGVSGSALAVGGVVLAVAFVALRALDETYGRDLDFHEV